MLKIVANIFSQSKKEFSDAFYLLLLQGVNQLLPLIVMPYLMIVLGADRYGYIGFSQSVIQYFILIVDFGFNLSATKRVAMAKDDPKALNLIFYSTVYAKLLLLLFSLFVFIVLLLTVDTFKTYSIALLCTFPMVVGSMFSFFWMYQGIGKIRSMAIINTLSKLVVLPLIFFLVKNPNDYALAALIQSLVYILTAIISCYYLFKWNIIKKVKVSMSNVWVELKESFPLFLSSASTSVYTQLFVVLLGFMSTPDVVGKYSAAEKIMRAMCFVLYTPISQAFFPKISSLSEKQNKRAQLLLKNVFILVGFMMFFVSLFLFLGSNYITDLLGYGYNGLSTLLRIFSLAPLAIGLGGILGQMGLVALGNYKTKIQFQNVYFIVAPISLILVSCLTPIYMETGAAWALVITEYIVFFLMAYYYRRSVRC
ncbi:MAG: flippase [Bacteroidaceae bacterium]